ncbi:hypothetical protein [Haloferula sp. BvORR071]|uniref:hypothetical protein n=1 Tax=Haloferula sp. BvORR071 TaxID=1396141 RepID=UPI00055646B8|nr:hypothetical protein [Haloferula sp. BvORR071]
MTLENQGQRVSDSAGRLRSLQSSSAHLPPAKRREYLRQELRKLVEELPAHERAAYLEEMLGLFPAEASAPAPATSPTAAAGDPVEQLAHAFSSLDPAAAATLAARVRVLVAAHAPSEGGSTGPDLRSILRCETESLPHLQLAITVLKSGKLDIRSAAALELLNVVKTAALLIDTFGGVESVFWKIWGSAAPKSQWQTPFEAGFYAETARLLEGKTGGSFATYSRSVTQSGQLLVALLSTIPSALDKVASAWLDQFAPERIAAEVRRTERGPLGGAPEQRFWREYEYRCADFTAARLAESFFRHLVEGTSSMIGPKAS